MTSWASVRWLCSTAWWWLQSVLLHCGINFLAKLCLGPMASPASTIASTAFPLFPAPCLLRSLLYPLPCALLELRTKGFWQLLPVECLTNPPCIRLGRKCLATAFQLSPHSANPVLSWLAGLWQRGLSARNLAALAMLRAAPSHRALK